MSRPPLGPVQPDSWWLAVGTLIVAMVGGCCAVALLALAARWFILAVTA